MRILSAETQSYGVRFSQPLRTASGTFTVRRGTLVCLQDETARCGWGDAAPWPGFGSDAAEVDAELAELPATLAGQTIADEVEAVAAAADSIGVLPEVAAATEQALLDLLGQRLGKPLSALLGGGRSEVQIHSLVADPAGAARAVSAGARALKLKVGGRDPAADVSAIAAVRRVVGPDVVVRVDANGAWDVDTACEMARRLSLIGVDWLEQPVPSGELDGLVAVRQASPVRVAADESIDGVETLARLVRAGAVDGVTLKPQVLGGLVVTQRLARRAHEAGLEVCITHAFESVVGRTGALHLAATLAAGGAHGLGHPFELDLADVDPAVAGHLAVPTTPGLGVSPRHIPPGRWPRRSSEEAS